VTEGDGQAHDDDAQPPQPGGPREHLAITNSLIRSLTNVSNVITLLPLCFASVAPNVAPKIHHFPRIMRIVAGVAGI